MTTSESNSNISAVADMNSNNPSRKTHSCLVQQPNIDFLLVNHDIGHIHAQVGLARRMPRDRHVVRPHPDGMDRCRLADIIELTKYQETSPSSPSESLAVDATSIRVDNKCRGVTVNYLDWPRSHETRPPIDKHGYWLFDVDHSKNKNLPCLIIGFEPSPDKRTVRAISLAMKRYHTDIDLVSDASCIASSPLADRRGRRRMGGVHPSAFDSGSESFYLSTPGSNRWTTLCSNCWQRRHFHPLVDQS